MTPVGCFRGSGAVGALLRDRQDTKGLFSTFLGTRSPGRGARRRVTLFCFPFSSRKTTFPRIPTAACTALGLFLESVW